MIEPVNKVTQMKIDGNASGADAVEPHLETVEAVLAAFGADAERGLPAMEASSRLARYGRNELTAEKPTPAWRKFLAQFTDVLVVLLIVAALISAALWFIERDSALPYEAIAILAIVILNAVMGYLQQARAEQALAALSQMSAAHATVVRDGTRQRLPASTRVPGALILIEEGVT
ncbi:MAG: cation-transporting P-type ATPase, partial [Pseudaminobacter sp.]